MNWFLIALITPIAHAASNHLDKYLISKYLKGGQVGALVLFSSLLAVIALPLAFVMDHSVLLVSPHDIVILMFNGALLVLAYICFFYALERDETSVVAPMFQMIPVFGFILGYFVLGEVISLWQFIAGLIILIGAASLSLNFDNNKIRIKKTVILLMIGTSILYAANGVLFKFVAENQQHFWTALFWDLLGKVVFGVLIFALFKSYRNQFLVVLKENNLSVLALNGLNEVLILVGEGALVFAVLLAPVALVQVVSGFQPVFVFVYGVLLTKFWPQFGEESLTKRHLTQKLVGIGVIVIGTILLNIC